MSMTLDFIVNNRRWSHTDEYESTRRMFVLSDADSHASRFLPFSAGFHGTVYSREDRRLLMYAKYGPNFAESRGRASYDEAYNYLSQGTYLRKWTPRGGEYFVMKGTIIQVVPNGIETLMCLCVDKNYFWNINWANPIDPEYFTLLINNKFQESSHYKKIEREYITDVKNAGIDVLFTNNIENKCYASSRTELRFSNPQEMHAYLRQFNSVVYDTTESEQPGEEV